MTLNLVGVRGGRVENDYFVFLVTNRVEHYGGVSVNKQP